MQTCKRWYYIFFILFLGIFVPPQGLGNASGPEKADQNKNSQKMVIKSDTLELDDELKTITFTGHVDATKGELRIRCNKMVVYYSKAQGVAGKNSPETGNKVDRIVATGDVRIYRSQGGMATAKKAVYHQKEDKLILTGGPMVKQGKSFVEGERIIIFVKENRSIVESGKYKRVKATIYPKGKE